ncbi:hypothetical protein [Allohahella sp. A8]|uniref:hypothetical protein n=1 Tax=Allohahella sp. A8 TaxID=3141461 RepID=UPI003A7F7FC9
MNVQPNVKGKYPVVVVSSPANYTPFAEMHFIPFWDVKMQSLGVSVDEGAVIFLREMAEKYKIDRSAVNLDNLEKADFGSLSGYSVIVESREEKGTDMQFFLGSGTLPSAVGVEDTFRHGDLSKARRGDGNGIIFIAVIAQSGRLQDLRHVIRRSWSNSGYLY